MEKMIAFCGLNCRECPAFIATQKDDDEARKKISKEWANEEFGIEPADVDCDGCLVTDGKLMSFCDVCDVRICALDKEVENCGHCTEYPCGKLDKIFKMAPDAKITLDEIERNL